VEASVPGIDPKEIDVTFNKGVLTIKAEKKEEEKGKAYHKQATRRFFYKVMPSEVDSGSEPKATYKNGVMTVTFAKDAKILSKKIKVKTI